MRCPGCNVENAAEASRCGSCGSPLRPPRQPARRRGVEEVHQALRGTGAETSWAARQAYRVCVLGLIPGLGLLLGPAAVVLGSLTYLGKFDKPLDPRAQNLAWGSVLLGALIALTNWLGLTLMILGLRG